MTNIINEYALLEKEIPELQKKLSEKNSKNSLLRMVTVNEAGIHWTPEFGKKYSGFTAQEGLNKYIGALKEALK